MTAVFSGGLVFEYSQEENGFGVVNINKDGSITELEGFRLFAKALGAAQDPDSNGGYKIEGTGSTSSCPLSSEWWIPKNDSLPRIPGDAASYYQNGAGQARGNQGAPKCSQWCGKNSTGLESLGLDKPNGKSVGASKSNKSGALSWRVDIMSESSIIVVSALLFMLQILN